MDVRGVGGKASRKAKEWPPAVVVFWMLGMLVRSAPSMGG